MKNENDKPNLDMNVADLMDQWPEVIPVFLRHRMACVGCSMAAFETLGGAARVYNLPPDGFLAEVLQSILP